MDREAMSARLWTLTNAITALAVLQALVFIYVALHATAGPRLGEPHIADAVVWAGIITTAAYVLAVWFCYLLAYKEVGTSAAWFFTCVGRTILIIAAGLILVAYGDTHTSEPTIEWQTVLPARDDEGTSRPWSRDDQRREDASQREDASRDEIDEADAAAKPDVVKPAAAPSADDVEFAPDVLGADAPKRDQNESDAE